MSTLTDGGMSVIVTVASSVSLAGLPPPSTAVAVTVSVSLLLALPLKGPGNEQL